jgi:hypothetical protein
MEKVAKCPVCNQGDLIEGTIGYMCNHFKSLDDKCSFTIYKSYFGKEITKEIVLQLSKHRESEVFNDLVSKENRRFSAKLVLQEGLIKPVFENKTLETACPKCGKKMHVSEKAFVCEGFFHEKECDLYIGRNVAGVLLSEKEGEVLLNGSSTEYRTDFLSRYDKEFGAKLILDEEYKVTFNYELVKCPKCYTGSVTTNHRAYGCSNYKNEQIKCEFSVWREISGKKITLKDLLDLCKKGMSDKTIFKPKVGEEYEGYYKLDQNFKLVIVPIS